MRRAKHEIAQRDRISVYELVVLKHCPAEERGDLLLGQVILEDDVTPLHPRLIEHQYPFPERRGDLADNDKSHISERYGIKERSQPLGIPCRFDEGDGILTFLEVVECDIGGRAFLPEVLRVPCGSQHGNIQIAHMAERFDGSSYQAYPDLLRCMGIRSIYASRNLARGDTQDKFNKVKTTLFNRECPEPG